MLLVREHPDWSDSRIAGEVKIDKSQLSRSAEFQAAAGLARGKKRDLPKGHVEVDEESGLRTVEAADPREFESGDESDRGQPIPGSKYHAETCASCGEAIRVPKGKVGTKPLCERSESL
jgi:hypothetical protein